MAPKKAAAKDAKAEKQQTGAKAGKDINGEEGLSKEDFAALHEELNQERKERGFLLVEKDQISNFWEITKAQLQEKKDELRNKNRDLEEAEERHQSEIQMFKEKVKYLLYEQQNKITQLKEERQVTIKLLEEEFASVQNQMQKEMQGLKVQLKAQELSRDNAIKSLQAKHDEETTQMRQDSEQKIREMRAMYEKKMENFREDQDLKCRQAIHETEERKNIHVSKMTTNHEKALSNINDYIRDTERRKDEKIASLLKKLEDQKRREDRLEKEMSETVEQNKLLTKKFEKTAEEAAVLQKMLVNYKTDKVLLKRLKGRIKETEKENRNLRLLNEVLEQRLTKVQKERDLLYENFVEALQTVQQTSGYKNLLLEKKVAALITTLEKQKPS